MFLQVLPSNFYVSKQKPIGRHCFGMQYFARNILNYGISAWVPPVKQTVTQNDLPACCLSDLSDNHISLSLFLFICLFFVCFSFLDHHRFPLRCPSDHSQCSPQYSQSFSLHLSNTLVFCFLFFPSLNSPNRLLLNPTPIKALSYPKYLLLFQDMAPAMNRNLSSWCVHFLCLLVLSGVLYTCFSF